MKSIHLATKINKKVTNQFANSQLLLHIEFDYMNDYYTIYDYKEQVIGGCNLIYKLAS